eukprot:CAMPEP_0174747306 /NCGR_PEP_ID=MMETSP1094-20130205/90915_1 /TAXON_ID=156173 /ORGANISM="Chrysochromulina brevifilum, Strain UTEX LB 985" /LENGTH=53 /DNA_ID=CAMNT_0015952151 /DNA_START=21 /DNA_END=182 /DNA_ORIENTATION=+
MSNDTADQVREERPMGEARDGRLKEAFFGRSLLLCLKGQAGCHGGGDSAGGDT